MDVGAVGRRLARERCRRLLERLFRRDRVVLLPRSEARGFPALLQRGAHGPAKDPVNQDKNMEKTVTCS